MPSVWAGQHDAHLWVSEWRRSALSSGVIVMIRTITNWPTTSAMIAALTPGRRRIATMLSLVVTPEAASAAKESPRLRAGTGPGAGR